MNNSLPDNQIYSEEELELFRNIENGNYKPLPNMEEERDKAQRIARNTIDKMTKRKSLNIRVIESDLPGIKALALREGVPYQTLITSILHKVATGKIKL